MRVIELIEALQKMPQDAYVWHLWDGDARTQIKHVWLSRRGSVITADDEMVCYTESTRPPSAPTEAQDKYWQTGREHEPPFSAATMNAEIERAVAAERERCAIICDTLTEVCAETSNGIRRTVAVNAAKSCAHLIRGNHKP